jgi:hypothetical protein
MNVGPKRASLAALLPNFHNNWKIDQPRKAAA